MPIDLRTQKLAQLAVRYSVAVKPGEKVLKVGVSGSFANSGKLIDSVKNLQGETVFEIGEP